MTLFELDSHNADYVEGLLEDYLQDPASVRQFGRQYFRELTDGNGETLAASQRPRSSRQRLQSAAATPAVHASS